MFSAYNFWNRSATFHAKQKDDDYLVWRVSSVFDRPVTSTASSRKKSFMIDDILKEDSREFEERLILPYLPGKQI